MLLIKSTCSHSEGHSGEASIVRFGSTMEAKSKHQDLAPREGCAESKSLLSSLIGEFKYSLKASVPVWVGLNS